jgi:hypothetical protein
MFAPVREEARAMGEAELNVLIDEAIDEQTTIVEPREVPAVSRDPAGESSWRMPGWRGAITW